MAASKRKKCRSAQKRKEAAARFKERPSTADDQALKKIFPTVRLRCNRPPVSQKDERKNWKQLAVEQRAADVASKEIVEHFKQNDPASLRRLLEAVDRTKRNFLRFRLWKTFKDCIPAHDRVTPLKAIRCDVTHAQCRALLAFALNFVFGGSLLNEEESRSLAAALVELLLCPRREHFLTPLDLSCFRSLLQHPIEFAAQFTKNTRKPLGENVVLFVTRHCLKILSQCFYATPATSPGGTLPRLALYRRNVWHKIERFSFEKLKMRQALREVPPWVINSGRKDHPYSDLRFLPKAKGTRPIGICRSIKNRWELRAEKLVLRYLYQRRAVGGNYVKPLYRIKQEIVKVATAFGEKKVFCFHGDLLDCFNRIDFKTIQQFLTENVSLDARYYVATVSAERRAKKGGRKVLYAVGRTKEEADRSLNAYQQRWRFLGNVGYSKGSSSCSSSNEPFNQLFIPGEKILRVVREYAARPWIKYKGKMYEYGRGILQGSPLSDTLNEIYQIMKTKYIFENARTSSADATWTTTS
ncbi:Telomerase reverse transcriptase-like protein [Aphelenchoides fujianensis]|nr:Telomerase reverse transcriptase-like protein [Aphelenchoides fujianensis]